MALDGLEWRTSPMIDLTALRERPVLTGRSTVASLPFVADPAHDRLLATAFKLTQALGRLAQSTLSLPDSPAP